MARALAFALGLAVIWPIPWPVQFSPPPPARSREKPMSVHNRLLLNRLAVGGYRRLQAMLLLDAAQFGRVAELVERAGGRVQRSETSIGYLRAELPIERFTEVVADPAIDAYQISSLSRGSWYRDGPPESNAMMFRGLEVAPLVRAGTSAALPSLPLLTPSAARDTGYMADADVGLDEWFADHPTFDGRGVTIAFIETGEAEFKHPTLGSAKALDGREVPKLVGILNAIDPDDPDDTRVELATEVRATRTWTRIGRRTYILPRPGTYRFGLFAAPAGGPLVHEFGVLRDLETGELRVDADGDADFRNDQPISDVNTRVDVRTFTILAPRRTELAFVVAAGRRPDSIHIYTARGSHQAMTVSVAAGSRTSDGLASGVAPSARVLLVRPSGVDFRLHNLFEAYLETSRRPDVDIVCDSFGLMMVPDTSADFAGLFVSRLIAAYRKPVFHAAGNALQFLNAVSALGGAFSVGGSIGPQTFAALYGGGTLRGTMVFPLSGAGPALDGALAPTFLAPAQRLAADLLTGDGGLVVPRHAPTAVVPPGYAISCCTSASSPYAAGVAALLLSAARQQQLPCSLETLARALRNGARFLEDSPAHQQGGGVLDVNAAWRELQRTVEVPHIRVAGPIAHALAMYAASGSGGVGLFEREGWTVGMRSERALSFTRLTGPTSPVSYRVSWTGNDGTFETAHSIALPLNKTISLPIAIAIHAVGAHSAILNVHDPKTDAVVARSAATIVASERFDERSRTLRLTGSVPLMASTAHYFTVPDRTAAIAVELDVERGSLGALLLPSHGLVREYYGHVFPQAGRTFTRGRYHMVLPQTAAGTWSITLTNGAIWREPDRALVSSDPAVYSLTVRLLDASLALRTAVTGDLVADATNRAAALHEAAIDCSAGRVTSHRAEFLPSGLPNQFELDVPDDTGTLALRVQSADRSHRLELHLYDCSSGECFSYDFTVPAASTERIVVRKPKPGRWVAAINPAPFATTRGGFVLEEIVTGTAVRSRVHGGPHPAGSTWTETLTLPSMTSARNLMTDALVCEVVDTATERAAVEHPWENRTGLTNFAERTVGLGMAVLPLR